MLTNTAMAIKRVSTKEKDKARVFFTFELLPEIQQQHFVFKSFNYLAIKNYLTTFFENSHIVGLYFVASRETRTLRPNILFSSK
jgi:hypothetical protein